MTTLVKPTSIPLWRHIQKENFTNALELADFLELSEDTRQKLLLAPKFALNLPRRLASKIAKNDPSDPLFRQFVPLLEEQIQQPGFVPDPVSDTIFRKEKKLLHKYSGRALLLPTSACAMHCRYCFRQNFPYDTTSDLTQELAYLNAHTDLREVILSGGDPLSLSDAALMQYLRAIDAIPHIRRIRFHTRFPIGIPERIDASFLELLSASQKQIYFTIHCNHPRELDPDVVQALRKIAQLGIPLFNQSVLLKGVNDHEETLLSLCEALVDAGIIPYYLNLLDPVQGSGHFEVSAARGRELLQYVQDRLSGYGVPQLVREEQGARSKTRSL